MAVKQTLVREEAVRPQPETEPRPADQGGPPADQGGPPALFGPALVSVVMALRGLGANKLRSVLTMLGVIIGVGAVIIAIAIGQGSREAVAESIQRLGTNVLSVRPGQQRRGAISFGFGSSSTLVLEDAAAILRSCPSVGRVSPEVSQSSQVKYENKNTNVTVNGTGEAYPLISNHAPQTGRYFTEQDVQGPAGVRRPRPDDGHRPVRPAVADRQVHPDRRPELRGDRLVKEKGSQGFRGNPDDSVYVPVTTAMRRLFGMENLRGITCQRALVRADEPGAAGDRNRAAPAAQDHRRQRGGLHHLQSGGACRDAERAAGHLLVADHVSGDRVPGGGRHRHREHHAGVGDRKDARDRRPQNHRGAPARHPFAVFVLERCSCHSSAGCSASSSASSGPTW